METLGYNSWKLPKGSKNELEKTFIRTYQNHLTGTYTSGLSQAEVICVYRTQLTLPPQTQTISEQDFPTYRSHRSFWAHSLILVIHRAGKNWPTYRLDLGDPRPQKQVLVDTFFRDRNAWGPGRRQVTTCYDHDVKGQGSVSEMVKKCWVFWHVHACVWIMNSTSTFKVRKIGE